jgi:mannose-1-phosphate guanylyltransferase/mannose-6-phosphate isomerase
MKNQTDLYCLIMAGGQGTRLWPASTSQRPKQYLKLFGDDTFLGHTVERFKGLVDKDHIFCVTVKEQEHLVKECVGNRINQSGVIIEPEGRNTAPCILLSLLALLENGAGVDDVVCVVPSDHVVKATDKFQETIKKAHSLAQSTQGIVTIGVKPSFPHTGFGYIHKGQKNAEGFSVQQFKEKPDAVTAQEYLLSGEYYWNAGMFLGSIKTFLEEFESHSVGHFEHIPQLKEALKKSSSFETLALEYAKLPVDSIDYAIMEKCQRCYIVEALFDWSDLGSWDAFEGLGPLIYENSVIQSQSGGELDYFEDASGNIVYAPEKFVSIVGLNDYVIVDNSEALMIIPKDQTQKVKQIVGHLKEKNISIY